MQVTSNPSNKIFVKALSPLLIGAFCAAAAVAQPVFAAKAAKERKSLYERLGGKEAIVQVIDAFVANVGADKRVNDFFAATVADPNRLASFKAKMVDQVCEGTGGPCKYQGKDMKTAHQGMGIRAQHFDAIVEDLVKAMNTLKVPKKEQKELLGILGPMKKDIVEKP